VTERIAWPETVVAPDSLDRDRLPQPEPSPARARRKRRGQALGRPSAGSCDERTITTETPPPPRPSDGTAADPVAGLAELFWFRRGRAIRRKIPSALIGHARHRPRATLKGLVSEGAKGRARSRDVKGKVSIVNVGIGACSARTRRSFRRARQGKAVQIVGINYKGRPPTREAIPRPLRQSVRSVAASTAYGRARSNGAFFYFFYGVPENFKSSQGKKTMSTSWSDGGRRQYRGRC